MPVPPSKPTSDELCLQGERILFVGKLTGMSRREVCDLVSQHGAEVAENEGTTLERGSVTLAVIGDSHPDLASALPSGTASQAELIEEVAAGRIELLHESELWQRIGLVGGDTHANVGVRKFYTPAMLAELLDVPVTAVRRWHRQGAILACQSVRRLPYFDFTEVAIARHLAALVAAGCSLRVIDRKLSELQRSLPDSERPLSDPSLVVSGRCLYVRRGDELAEPGGQLLIDFDKPDDAQSSKETADSLVVLSITSGGVSSSGLAHSGVPQSGQIEGEELLSTLDQLQQVALEWEDQGELERAAETYRTMLVAGGPTAELHFALADLLYRADDLPAARERYYAAIEIDEQYVEARANLGCVLAENGEIELAVAAFRGALTFHPDYADVHYHLAGALDRSNLQDEAEHHWRSFLALAPESPWAELARTRLGLAEQESASIFKP